jgi:RecA/RadA recombinase
MIIEFFGPPGSGKTTVAQEAARLLASTGVGARAHNGQGFEDLDGRRLAPWRIWLSRVTGPASRPRLVAAGMKHVTGKHGASRLMALCRRDQFKRRLGTLPGVRFLDEGPLQSLCGLAAACSTWPLDLLPRVSSPTAAVLVSADADASLRRTRSRDRGMRFDRLSDADILREHAAHMRFSAAIAAHARFPVMRIDNQVDGDIEAVARDVAKLIGTLVVHPTGRN